MTTGKLNPLDYQTLIPRKRVIDWRILIAVILQLLLFWIDAEAIRGSNAFLLAGLWFASLVLFSIGAVIPSISRLLYALAAICALVETAFFVFDKLSRGVEETTFDQFILFVLLHPLFAIWLASFRRIDWSLFLIASLQLALMPLIVRQLPPLAWWARYRLWWSPVIGASAWAGYCGLIGCGLWGLLLGTRSPAGPKPRLVIALVVSVVFILIARVLTDHVQFQNAVWIKSFAGNRFDYTPLSLGFRAYVIASASPLMLLELSRLRFRNRTRTVVPDPGDPSSRV